MLNIELQEAFELELDLLDDGLNKPKSTDTEWWLNRGLEKFWKTRYSGVNYKGLGFEQSQKRIDDLRTLVKHATIAVNTVNSKEYTVTLPEDYLIHLGDTVGIAPADNIVNECWETDLDGNYIVKTTDTLEATIENIDRQKDNPLSEYRLKYCSARPLRMIQGDEVLLFTDGNYKVSEYSMTYLRRPAKIDIHTHPMNDYTDMPEHTHSEIVKIAAQMYLENKTNPRLNSHNSEVREME